MCRPSVLDVIWEFLVLIRYFMSLAERIIENMLTDTSGRLTGHLALANLLIYFGQTMVHVLSKAKLECGNP